MTNVVPAPIEKKVTAATAGSYLGGIALLAILNAIGDINLLSSLPPVAEVFIAPLIPTLITFVGGFTARHTPRVDSQV